MALAIPYLQLAPEVFVLEPTLMLIGVNHFGAPLAMRERFWIGENRRYEVLRRLKDAEGIEEVLVLSTRCRTEFLVWANEPMLAANSVLQYLTAEHGLKLSEWEHFYRHLDDSVLTHVFRLACGLDCLLLCGLDAVTNLTAAWEQARTVGASGRYLNALLEQALTLSTKARQDHGTPDSSVCLATVARELSQQVFGSLQGRKVLLLGTGPAALSSAHLLLEQGAGPLVVIDKNPALAQEFAQKLGATAATQTDRWGALLKADIVISASGCPHYVLTREEAERIAAERNRVALLILDMNLPRDIDPEVRRVDGILLYDLDGMERGASRPIGERTALVAEIEKLIASEVQAFRGRMQAQIAAPTTVVLRQRLDEICRQELESFLKERGPFTREQDQLLHAITAQVIHKIAGSLARELKDVPEKEKQELTNAVTRLFHLQSPQPALAGTRSQKQQDERAYQRAKNRAVANY